MVVLGVDPAITTTGYALLKFNKNCTQVIDYGCIKTDSKKKFPLRLKDIYSNIIELIRIYKPQALAIEEVFYSQNIQIALKMGQARGVTLLAAANFLLSTFEYSPREVKQAVTGNGAATKQQVQKMVVHLLNLSFPLDLSADYKVHECLFCRIGCISSFLYGMKNSNLFLHL